MSPSTAYFLVAHGSRDRRLTGSLSQLQQQFLTLRPNLLEVAPPVATGTLEFGSAPLADQLRQFGQQVWSQGIHQLHILPLFLQHGVHVREDIPAAIAEAQHTLPPPLKLQLSPILGSHPGFAAALGQTLMAEQVDTWVLLAHGSRRPGGNQPVEHLATKLQIATAYWSVDPSLEHRVQECLAQGHHRIGVIPYFLFPGKITDRIATWITERQHQACQAGVNLDFVLANPLNTHLSLASLLWDLIQLRIS
ncbi:sirohydrochlorin chelatase [Synechococcales cyanobacterium C]|uniref:Sirohydrochlorin chelatase n=1 Tax=Petrachloros mirabilis ULC683 TaxID=2781853 RepID=A0A8K2A849_9CYAN|nr:sirohydrochlorin chelatase [Petrachloros mirabilis]NCJ06620.1 sirohydrochlorin chelatase [Petrachloros mirabilis ULC683]